ncbi:uncharacterized protein [Scyliorhinus torazame]|uniref:uncharacterized protein isoform X2 n=1 Tax=Scyliorhinus torazame TaxID=75743 RepID=UPI003B58EB55
MEPAHRHKFLTVLTSLMDVAYIITGITYHGSCTKARSLPLYLVTCGICDLVFTIISLTPQTPDNWDRSGGRRLFSLSHSFHEQWEYVPEPANFLLFAAGNLLIYSIHQPNYESLNSPEYCAKSLYLFALYTHLGSYAVYLILTLSRLLPTTKGQYLTLVMAHQVRETNGLSNWVWPAGFKRAGTSR